MRALGYGALSLENYFNLDDCPSVENLSIAEVKGICLHVQSRVNLDGLKVLSLGCGDGRIEEFLLTGIRPKKLTCVDLSDRNLQIARQRLPKASFIQVDLRNFSDVAFESYNLIFSISVAQYLAKEELKTLHEKLLKHLESNGKIFHFNIPDKRRRFLYRLNSAIVMKDWKYLLPSHDFIDEFSRWHDRSSFYAEGYQTKFFTPSYHWERFDALLEKVSPL